MKFMTTALIAAATFTTLANAQTTYQPIRYQYGQYNEIFYGGSNPAFTSNNYGYLPEYMHAAYTSRRQNTTLYPYPSPYTLYGPGTPFFSPHNQSLSIQYQFNNPLIFSDSLPFEEVGQFGFTQDDARNEAYLNAPRIQFGGAQHAQGTSPQKIENQKSKIENSPDPRLKAIPLLNWAKAEHTRNPALYKALVQEAAKYDPDATAALEKQWEATK
jgi:hypothetical protein